MGLAAIHPRRGGGGGESRTRANFYFFFGRTERAKKFSIDQFFGVRFPVAH